MDAIGLFDFAAYMGRLTAQNRLARARGFRAVTCSGVNYLEGLLEEYQDTAAFVATSDVCDESTLQRGGGWFRRRLVTVFVLERFDWGDEDSRRGAMADCRELARQFLSRMLSDAEGLSNDMLYLNTGDVRCTEIGGSFLNGCTGLYFMMTMDEPTDLCYRAEEWETEGTGD